VKRSLAEAVLVPLALVTVISTAPMPGGEIAVIDVAELTVKPVALAEPNFTVAPLKLVPVMVTEVPPLGGPEAGETAVTVGGPM
jgi:hypothetical protein